MLWDRMDLALSIRVFLRTLGKPLYYMLEFFLIAVIYLSRLVNTATIQSIKLLSTGSHNLLSIIDLLQRKLRTSTCSVLHAVRHSFIHLIERVQYLSSKLIRLFRSVGQTRKGVKSKTSVSVYRTDRNQNSLFSHRLRLFIDSNQINQTVKRWLKTGYFRLSRIRHLFRRLGSIIIRFHPRLPRLPSLPVIPQPPLKHLPLIVTGLTLIVGGYFFYTLILKDLPHPKDLLTLNQPVTSVIYDRHGQILYKMYKDENRSIVSLDQIPPHVIQATLAIEDAEFYQHAGFSVRGIIRALENNFTRGTLEGGSTITQQLIKNTLLTPEKTYVRKIRELILALLVESYFTKDEILSMYFNEVPYGGTAYGIEAAAQTYFHKTVTDLNLAEAAFLAGLPAAPTTYSPYGANPHLSTARQHEVLRRMVELGYISPELATQAKNVSLAIAPPTNDILAPHFVMYVKDQLVDQYGEALVSQGGLQIITSLDLSLQKYAENLLKTEVDNLAKLQVTNAAAIVTKPRTGEILAMVGSIDFFDFAHDGQVNVVTRPRQPGSSIKPVNYAVALERGLTAATRILDAPVTYKSPGSPPYSPQNYDGRFHGTVTLRSALANSYNVPAVKTLNQFGVSAMVSMGQALGITTWTEPNRFGLALTLGGGEVTLADMATVYGTLANYGQKVSLHPIQEVTNWSGSRHDLLGCRQPVEKIAFPRSAQAKDNNACPTQTVLKDSSAFILTSILSDNDARTPTFGRHSILNIANYPVAVKTGTTNNLRDNWTIGYTPDYLVGVWVGNNDNTPMSRIASGITGASPIWSQLMTKVLENTPPQSFPIPDSVTAVTVCPLTGTLACSACPNPKTEYFAKGTEPTKGCSPEFVQKVLEEKAKQETPPAQ